MSAHMHGLFLSEVTLVCAYRGVCGNKIKYGTTKSEKEIRCVFDYI